MTASRLESLQRFLEDDPADAFTHYAIALEYISMNNIPDAIDKFGEVITLDPNYVPAYHQLGLLLLRQNRIDEGKIILEHGIEVARLTGDAHAQSEMEEAIEDSGL